jgi:hypothetical protein
MIAFAPNSAVVALASSEATWLWDYTKKGARPEMLEDNRGRPVGTETVTFSPDGKELIAALVDKGLEMWRWSTVNHCLLSTVVMNRTSRMKGGEGSKKRKRGI